MQHPLPIGKIFGTMFIIAGTCVGAGMLALPVAGAEIGFMPSVAVMLFTYILMTLGGLFYLEASLWFQDETHIVSMSERFMGRFAKWLCSGIYFFIAYASLVAYLSEGSKLIYLNVYKYFGLSISPYATYFLYLLGMAAVLLFSTKVVSRVSSIMVGLMVVAYVVLLSYISPHIDHELVATSSWKTTALLGLTPVMLSSFSYPGIVPAMVIYLKRNVTALRLAIVGGTTLAFLIYAVWLYIVFSVVPHFGPGDSLSAALADGSSAIIPLQNTLGRDVLAAIASAFGFLAITTSFIGIGYGLVHFLADGLGEKLTIKNRVVLTALVAVLTLLGCIVFENIFISALDLTGGIGDSAISLMFPALIVLIGMKRDQLSATGSWYSRPVVLLTVVGFGCYQIIAELVRFI